ncbi:MAG TPA: D-amino acid aminotransferase [Thiotrichaceae bacterium]|jgi:D-alanine transaminase|nr:D-amino acid aminotransferase [Thiotrichaceae bacterium]HIM07934.1 D-amino acid aminotransferase [Gammaproteobacteria bacterium]
MTTVYINGDFKPLSEASVNVLDRGFTFGDGVYEVIPVFNRKIFRFDEHIQRLENSLKALYMDNPLTKDQWLNIFNQLVDASEALDQSIYLQITRGVTERDHDISLADSPTVFSMSRPIVKKDLSSGIKVITHEDIRWQYCDIKAITLLPSVILRHKAKEQGAKEAILIRDGYITEGAASNVFIIKGDTVFTPPKNRHVLSGITRDLLIEILSTNNINCLETPVEPEQLFDADEIWITSSTWEIVPVIDLDNKPVGQGFTGPMWEKANHFYQEFKKQYNN